MEHMSFLTVSNKSVLRMRMLLLQILKKPMPCKYQYQEIEKRTFEQAKAAALSCLDACPDDVLRRFINWSWRFISAYRRGLIGAAVAWAVRTQKSHRTVSASAMMSLGAVLNV